MKKTYSIALLVLLLICAAKGSGNASATQTREVKVYLVALGDAGKLGKKIGCDDSLVPVTRSVKATGAPLTAALQELLNLPSEYPGDSRLNNFWLGEKLRLKSVAISKNGTATIYIIGEGPFVAGICDEPRIISQIEETAKQFATVKRVKVFINGRTLADAIR
jgi:spore germination protein GerM